MIICDTGDFSAIELTASDYARSAELVVTYGDLPLGTTDASVIAIAERLKLTEVATLTLLPQPPQAPTVTTRSRQRW